MKKILCIAAVFLLIFTFCSCGSVEEKYPEHTEKFYVNDFANVIDDNTETEFYSKAVALNKVTTAQVVLVTVETLNGEASAEYALELGRKWGVGNKDNDNGIVVLLATEEREIYIAVGYGLEGALPDSKTGRIIDVYGLSYFRNDDFSTGLAQIGNALINEVYIEYGLEPEAGYVNIENAVPPNEDEGGGAVIAWIIMIIIIILLTFFSGRFGGLFIFFSPRVRYGSSMFHGGFGGSGRSGFGGFSGGGGSFGGGGAGRGF